MQEQQNERGIAATTSKIRKTLENQSKISDKSTIKQDANSKENKKQKGHMAKTQNQKHGT